MSQRYYDDWLAKFVEFASYGEAPLKMLYWTGVSTVAGALRRRVWIDQKYFQWLSNFYIVFVAPPGIVSKTTTANIGMNLLRDIPEGIIKFGADSVTWQSMITSLAENNESVPDPVNLGTFLPMSSVTFCSDELGNLLTPSDDKLISALITLWDGKAGGFKKDTKSQGKDKIENPWVNIIGCTTPGWIGQNVPESMVGGGLMSRIVFLYADQKRQYIDLPADNVPSDFDEVKKRLVHDLEMISMMFGEFKLDQEVKQWSKLWYQEHWDTAEKFSTDAQYSGYVARKQTHIFKLAMILAAAQSSDLVLHKHNVLMAQDMMTATEMDMPKIFARIGQNAITRGTTDILYAVGRKPGISQRELYHGLMRGLTHKEFTESISGAVNSGKIITRQIGNELKYYISEDKGEPGEPPSAVLH